jgi:hypothetical protein
MADKIRRVADPESASRTSSLTPDELDQVRAEARETVAQERRKAAMKAALDLALREERVAAGLEKADTAWEKVEITLDLPDNITPHACLTVDGRAYWHGTPYTVTVDVARSLLDMQARAWENQSREEGKWFDPRRMAKRGTDRLSGLNMAQDFL